MFFQKIIGVMAVLVAAAFATPSRADWDVIDRNLGYGQGAAGCSAGGYGTACLALRCEQGGQLQLAVIGSGLDIRAGRATPVYLQIDGGQIYALEMQPGHGRSAPEAFVDYDAGRYAGLLDDLRRGRDLRIGLWRQDALRNAPGISLSGATRALEQGFSLCGNGQYSDSAALGAGDWQAPRIDPSAQPRWQSFSGFRAGASYCPVQGKWNSVCLALSCEPDRPLELEIALQGTIGGWATAGVSQLDAAFSVDGWHADTLRMQRDAFERNAQIFRTPLSQTGHERLLQALSRGNAAGLTLAGGRGQVELGLGLAGSAKAIAAALAACPYDTGNAGYLAPSADATVMQGHGSAVSAYDGERPGRVATRRFVPMFDGRRNLTMEDTARRLMAQDIGQIGDGALVITTSLSLAAGRSLLAVVLGPSVSLYGETGSGTVIWVVGDDGEKRVYAENGVAVWADQENLSGGMPDLWVQPMQGLNEPFALWRWNGRDYAFSESIAP